MSILICQTAGMVGSIFTIRSVDTWYAGIEKPVFNPPNWVFGPVWTVLYLLMGVSLFLVWRKGIRREGATGALVVFLIQLLLNGLWSFAFFGCRSPLAGLAVIVLLWAAILATIARFSRISRPAAILLVPYIAWVSFAVLLNGAVFMLNS